MYVVTSNLPVLYTNSLFLHVLTDFRDVLRYHFALHVIFIHLQGIHEVSVVLRLNTNRHYVSKLIRKNELKIKYYLGHVISVCLMLSHNQTSEDIPEKDIFPLIDQEMSSICKSVASSKIQSCELNCYQNLYFNSISSKFITKCSLWISFNLFYIHTDIHPKHFFIIPCLYNGLLGPCIYNNAAT